MIYTTYSPRNHVPGTIHETKAAAIDYTPIGKVEEEHGKRLVKKQQQQQQKQ